MATNGTLRSNKFVKGRIYLPFCPHFFGLVWSKSDLQLTFEVSYLHELDLTHQNHKLWYVTSIATKLENNCFLVMALQNI